jgi:hypothetical protein
MMEGAWQQISIVPNYELSQAELPGHNEVV